MLTDEQYIAQVFTRYNQIKSDPNSTHDPARLDRALGLAQKRSTWHVLQSFAVTDNHCGCPDFQHRQSLIVGGQCKHQLANRLMRIEYDWSQAVDYDLAQA